MAVTKTIKINMTKEQWNAINQGLNGRRLDEFALIAMLKEVGAGSELINPQPPPEPNSLPLPEREAASSIDEAANEQALEPRPAIKLRTTRDREQQHNSHRSRKDVKPAPNDGRPARTQSGRRSGSK
jgi:hypothetical protein